MGDACQIVTGVTEKGAETVIWYWIQQRGSKQPKKSKSLKSRSLVAGKRGLAYVTTHVRKDN